MVFPAENEPLRATEEKDELDDREEVVEDTEENELDAPPLLL